jgi:hypothetical protein
MFSTTGSMVNKALRLTSGFHMKRVYKKSKDFKEAEEWDILQNVHLTPEERQEAAAELRRRVFGSKLPAMRKAQGKK